MGLKDKLDCWLENKGQVESDERINKIENLGLKNLGKIRIAKKLGKKAGRLVSLPLILGLALSGDSSLCRPMPDISDYLAAQTEYVHKSSPQVEPEDICMDICREQCITVAEKIENSHHKELEEAINAKYETLTKTRTQRIYLENSIKRINIYDEQIEKYAEKYSISEYSNLMKAIAITETGARHWGIVTTRNRKSKLVSKRVHGAITTGADMEKGMFQIMPSTAKWLGINPRKLEQNIEGAVKLMSIHIHAYDGNIALALNAYNSGKRTMSKITNKAESLEYMDYKNFTPKHIIKQVENYPLKVLAILKFIEEYEAK